jgi:hypothetical protein
MGNVDPTSAFVELAWADGSGGPSDAVILSIAGQLPVNCP